MADKKLEVAVKACVSKPGGTASKKSLMVRIPVPAEVVKDLNITKEDRNFKLTYDKNKVIEITKISDEEYTQMRGKKNVKK